MLLFLKEWLEYIISYFMVFTVLNKIGDDIFLFTVR